MDELFPGIFRQGDRIYTENGAPGKTVYGEATVIERGTEFRSWDARRSKAAAAIRKDISSFPIDEEDAVLYLGASTGTTASHMADLVSDGMVYAIEYSPEIMRALLNLSRERDNIAPILGDARKPAEYRPLVSQVDVLYQDVAQKDQARILTKNANMFLKDGGIAMIAIKAQSISSTRPADEVFDEVKEELSSSFEVIAGVKLAPFHTDHLFLVLRKR